eukprot:gene10052-2224_t
MDEYHSVNRDRIGADTVGSLANSQIEMNSSSDSLSVPMDNTEFLSSDVTTSLSNVKAVTWEHNMRWNLQEIVPRIFLGPYRSATLGHVCRNWSISRRNS